MGADAEDVGSDRIERLLRTPHAAVERERVEENQSHVRRACLYSSLLVVSYQFSVSTTEDRQLITDN